MAHGPMSGMKITGNSNKAKLSSSHTKHADK
jgi:hypothetical protein